MQANRTPGARAQPLRPDDVEIRAAALILATFVVHADQVAHSVPFTIDTVVKPWSGWTTFALPRLDVPHWHRHPHCPADTTGELAIAVPA
jgi:hypothetical protein